MGDHISPKSREGEQFYDFDIPDYDDSYKKSQTGENVQLKRLDGNYAQRIAPQQLHVAHKAAYSVAGSETSLHSPLSPPRQHRNHAPASPDFFTMSAQQPQRPPRPDARSPDHASPSQQRHNMYQKFFNDQPKSPHHGDGEWTGEGYKTEANPKHVTDFGALVRQIQGRAPLGPPPSARRGPASYYQDQPAVHPIVEESGRNGSQADIFREENEIIGGFRDDRSSNYSEHPAPLGQSLPRRDSSTRGKQFGVNRKQSNKLLNKIELLRKGSVNSNSTNDTREFPLVGTGERRANAYRSAESEDDMPTRKYTKSDSRSFFASGSALFDDSSDSEGLFELDDKRSVALSRAGTKVSRSRSNRTNRTKVSSPLMPPIFYEEETSSATTPLSATSSNGPRTLSERVGARKPARLNMAAVKSAEARGSLTSLPDLIQRATKLASNLDRGKTASKVNSAATTPFGQSRRSSIIEKNGVAPLRPRQPQPRNDMNRSSEKSMSFLMNSFPAPAISPGPNNPGGRPMLSHWSSGLRNSVKLGSSSDLGDDEKNQPRRCCGMPMWLVMLLLTLGVIAIVLAIVLPIVLIVIPGQHPATNACATQIACQNGGTANQGSNGTCVCNCLSGFSGATCADAQSNCIAYTSGSANASIGTSLPRLLNSASSTYGVPLDNQKLLGIFNSQGISCTAENSLVTFNVLANQQNRREIERMAKAERAEIVARDAASATSSAGAQTTTNGIVFQTGSPTDTTSSTTTTGGGIATASATSGAGSGSGSGSGSTESSSFKPNSTTIDFASIAVLYILQSSGQLKAASDAQQNFQTYISLPSQGTPDHINLGNGATADVIHFKISLNGTSVGGH